MKKQKKSAKEIDSGLQLPNWTGMDELSARITRDRAFELCEEYHREFRLVRRRDTEQGTEVDVEFVL
jgi:hypothetical protein